MIYKIFVSIFFALLFFSLTTVSKAQSEFSDSYEVNYDVGVDGITDVSENVTLTNLTDTYFASSYNLSIGSTTVSEVSASDSGGKMQTEVQNKDNQTLITIKFNQQITGYGKKQNFTLKYKSKDFAQKIGKTWEINLPRIEKKEDIDSFHETLSVPLSFGEPTSIIPQPILEFDKSGRLYFTFDKNQLEKSGVSLDFGTNQIFDFKLTYDLKNPSFLAKITSLALPSDTNYQDILISSIEPKPLNVTIDADGNYLAWYQIQKRENLEVKVQGLAKLYIKPQADNFSSLTDSQIKTWTKPDKYWEKDNPVILAALKEIFKDEKPNGSREKAKLIYRYVVNTLTYDPSRLNNLERLGAVTALNNQQKAVCMEFTDLFIALTRASGIPARELDGYAYSQNKNLRPLSFKPDLLHSWPEYFDEKKGWVMVDPTWENTSGGVDYFNKFDLNHLVLAIKGESSVKPNPADSVTAEISEAEFKPLSNAQVEIKINDTLWAGFPSSAEILISNIGTKVLLSSKMEMSASKLLILNSQTVSTPSIPPHGYFSYKIDLRSPFVWKNLEDEIIINYLGQNYSKTINIKPIFFIIPIPYLFVAFIALLSFNYLAILFIHTSKNRHK